MSATGSANMGGTVRRLAAGAALLGVTGLLVATALVLGRPHEISPPRAMPDFTGIDDVDARKQKFFDFLRPIVVDVNQEVLERRQRLREIRAHLERGGRLTRRDRRWLERMAVRYRVGDQPSPQALIEALLPRVDRVPASLALSQAAIESGWGRSRFAVEGNNLFGQWCFNPGCGMIPAARGPHADHEVEVFASVDAAVRSYVRNLNSHPAYDELRAIRAQARADERDVSGRELAWGLMRYSERGQHYVDEVQAVINANDLEP